MSRPKRGSASLVFNDVMVVQWEAQPVWLHKPAREEHVCRLDDRRMSACPSKIMSFGYQGQQLLVHGKSSEPTKTSAIKRFCIFEPRSSRWACSRIGATHVFFPHVPVRRTHPPV